MRYIYPNDSAEELAVKLDKGIQKMDRVQYQIMGDEAKKLYHGVYLAAKSRYGLAMEFSEEEMQIIVELTDGFV